MKVVLYNHDMEPITILNIDRTIQGYIETRPYFRIRVPERIDWRWYDNRSKILESKFRIVTIDVTPLYMRCGHKSFLLMTRDEEDALLLESAFLPGQRQAILDEREEAYSKGFADAFLGFKR